MAYDGARAVAYAKTWAFARNPLWGDFSGLGGDCANFASQCLFAGGCGMDFSPEGWFYRSMRDRAPAWSGSSELMAYLLRSGRGEACRLDQLLPGGLIFLSNGSRVYHVLVAVRPDGENTRVASHTRDALMAPLSGYEAAAFFPVRIAAF